MEIYYPSTPNSDSKSTEVDCQEKTGVYYTDNTYSTTHDMILDDKVKAKSKSCLRA